MAESEMKDVVESPASAGDAIAKRSIKEPELAREFDTIFDEFRRSFNDLMAPFLPMRMRFPRTFGSMEIRAPLVDVMDEGSRYIINTELPGFDKDDVDIQLNKDILVIKAEKKSEEEEKAQNYLHRERSYSSCQRTVNFPEEVDPAQVEGTMKNGVLTLKIPKKEPKPGTQMIKVELK